MFESESCEVLERVAAGAAARDAVVAETALAVAEAIRRDAFAAAGLVSGTQWLRAYTESSREDAGRLVSLGRLLAWHDATRAAVAAGRLSVGRAGVLARAVTDARRPHFEVAESVLLEQAAVVHRVDDFEVVVAHWCALVDQELEEGPPEAAQHLVLSPRLFGGVDVRGQLDAPTFEVLDAALHACDTGPDAVGGPAPVRSLAERRADALADVARHALRILDPDLRSADLDTEPEVAADAGDGGGDDGDGHVPARLAPRSRRTTNIVVDLPSLAGRTHTDLDGIVATLDGRPLSAWAVDRLLCGSWVAALVTDADGVVVDATDRSADFTPTQRRLVAARDRHCVFPGCDLPASWCDVHHVHWRSQGGGRALENGALLCQRHHTLVHKGWHLERDDGGGWQVTSPGPNRTIWTGRPAPPRPTPERERQPA